MTINIYVIVCINLLHICMYIQRRRYLINYKVASAREVFFYTLAEVILDHILHFILNTDILLLLYNNYWSNKTLLESWKLNLVWENPAEWLVDTCSLPQEVLPRTHWLSLVVSLVVWNDYCSHQVQSLLVHTIILVQRWQIHKQISLF